MLGPPSLPFFLSIDHLLVSHRIAKISSERNEKIQIQMENEKQNEIFAKREESKEKNLNFPKYFSLCSHHSQFLSFYSSHTKFFILSLSERLKIVKIFLTKNGIERKSIGNKTQKYNKNPNSQNDSEDHQGEQQGQGKHQHHDSDSYYSSLPLSSSFSSLSESETQTHSDNDSELINILQKYFHPTHHQYHQHINTQHAIPITITPSLPPLVFPLCLRYVFSLSGFRVVGVGSDRVVYYRLECFPMDKKNSLADKLQKMVEDKIFRTNSERNGQIDDDPSWLSSSLLEKRLDAIESILGEDGETLRSQLSTMGSDSPLVSFRYKRYNDFVDFFSLLEMISPSNISHSALLPLPRPQWKFLTNHFEKEFIEKRRRGIQMSITMINCCYVTVEMAEIIEKFLQEGEGIEISPRCEHDVNDPLDGQKDKDKERDPFHLNGPKRRSLIQLLGFGSQTNVEESSASAFAFQSESRTHTHTQSHT